ncbi:MULTISPECIES: hypothetical protein [Pseudomonas]|uniref:Secreted protein n=1 Tax=Pseudomonas knackmussii TaxID=65741 RepID=A0ABY4KTU5_9PSED|nr:MULTISPECIES: hypothetical protein [Pseudomonas]UPQ83018.1 hypothetical protein M0M42_00965 [Pseudomonas knackmussii]
MMRIWLWPVLIAALSAVGLVAGLVSEGAGDWLNWLALSVPVVLSVHGFRRRKPQRQRDLSVRAQH